MPTALDGIRADFDDRERKLEVFEHFSGTGTPGEDGAPDVPAPGEDDPGLSVSDSLALATFASLGLTGVSYAVNRYSAKFVTKDPADPLLAMKLVYDRMQVAKALEAAQEGKSVTKLIELLPYVGTPVKRMNIDKLWGEVEKALAQMKVYTDNYAAGYQQWENNWEFVNKASKAGYIGFGSVSAVGLVATAVSAGFHDRAFPLLDELEAATDGLGKNAAAKVEDALSEFDFRSSEALGDVDRLLLQVEKIAAKLPDPDDLVDMVADVEELFKPITRLTADISGLVKPYEDFLEVAEVIGAPIEGVLKLFENPPKVLPTITGYKTVTPGFWLTVPDPSLTNPFRTKEVWVPPVKVPIPGFKEIFDPIPRAEVQKIIDLVLKIAGLPQELLEKALAPLLTPIQGQIDKILRPIVDKLNPFEDYLDDFNLAEETVAALREKITAVVDEIEAAVDKVAAISPQLDPVEEIGKIDPDGMPTFFGTRDGEKIIGMVPEKNGGFLTGAILMGNAGADTILGTNAFDLLGGGSGSDTIRAKNGNDMVLGGNGHDFLHGGTGSDVIIGGNGNDKLVGSKGAGHAGWR